MRQQRTVISERHETSKVSSWMSHCTNMEGFRGHSKGRGKLRQIPIYSLNRGDTGKILVSAEKLEFRGDSTQRRELFIGRTVRINRGISSSIS